MGDGSNEGTATIVQGAGGNLSLCKTCQSCLAEAHGYVKIASDMRFQVGPMDAEITCGRKHHASYESWQAAIHSSCYICRRLKDLIPSSVIEEWQQIRTSELPSEREGLLYCSTLYPPQQPWRLRILTKDNYGVRFASWTVDPTERKTAIYDVGETTNSSHTWATILEWLQDCTQKHESCALANNVNEGWYPTRLLDLGGLDSEAGNIKLIETAQSKLEGPYITLSHSWGGGSPIILTTENRLHFYVKVLNLPKTFEDAVEVTRRLGVRYLWIDSLCIIQDDTTDWAREAAVMYDVYKNAWCNLSATAARNSNGGLFWNRGRHSLVGQLVVNTSEKSVSGSQRQATDSLAANPKALLLLEDDLVVLGVERSPLQGRAWVLQERFLSRRVLHFAENQIFWECNQKCACEMFPDGILNGISYDGLRTVMPPGIPWIHVWTWAVRRYTERCHTYSSDKLPALSGIAKFFAPKLGGSYLAGIWRYEEFARQLAWYVDMEPSKLLSRPDYRAPTWSWASVDGAVRFPERRDEYRPMIELIDAEVTPKGDDPTGAVASGFLLVKGSLGHIPAGSRKSILGAAFVNFDIAPEPAGDMYLLPLYMDSESEYHGRSRDTAHPTFYTHYLLLIPHELDSSCFRRCGYAVPKNSQPYFHSTRVLQIGENLTRQGQFRIL